MNLGEARKILGVGAKASVQEIEAATKDKRRQHHPDQENGNEKKFKQLGEARDLLLSKKSSGRKVALSRDELDAVMDNALQRQRDTQIETSRKLSQQIRPLSQYKNFAWGVGVFAMFASFSTGAEDRILSILPFDDPDIVASMEKMFNVLWLFGVFCGAFGFYMSLRIQQIKDENDWES